MVRALLKNYHQKRIAVLQLHTLGRQMFVPVFTERELQPEEFWGYGSSSAENRG
jgi:hypothetical protein